MSESRGLKVLSVLALFLGGIGLSGCDPLIQIGGAYFPCWLFCPIVGIGAAFLCRPVFVALRVENSLYPRGLVYFSIAILASCMTYVIFFR